MKLATTLLVACAGGLLTLGLVMSFSAGMTVSGGRYTLMPAGLVRGGFTGGDGGGGGGLPSLEESGLGIVGGGDRAVGFGVGEGRGAEWSAALAADPGGALVQPPAFGTGETGTDRCAGVLRGALPA